MAHIAVYILSASGWRRSCNYGMSSTRPCTPAPHGLCSDPDSGNSGRNKGPVVVSPFFLTVPTYQDPPTPFLPGELGQKWKTSRMHGTAVARDFGRNWRAKNSALPGSLQHPQPKLPPAVSSAATDVRCSPSQTDTEDTKKKNTTPSTPLPLFLSHLAHLARTMRHLHDACPC